MKSFFQRGRIAGVLVLISISGIGWSSNVLSAVPSDDPFYLGEIPTVVTPARFKQPKTHASTPVTVITDSMIKALNIRTIPDALRLVPSMSVEQLSGQGYSVSYQGGDVYQPRRLQVLVDGVSIYRPALARVKWSKLPVNINDVERIEVTRSPSTPVYGENAFLATINIITHIPSEVVGESAQIRYDDPNARGAWLRYADVFSGFSYRLSYDHQEDDGFDVGNFNPQASDSTRLDRMSFRGIKNWLSGEELDVRFSLLDGAFEKDFETALQISTPEREDREGGFAVSYSKPLSEKSTLKLNGSASRYSKKMEYSIMLPTAAWSEEAQAALHQYPKTMYGLFVSQNISLMDLSPEEFAVIFPAVMVQAQFEANGQPVTLGEVNNNLDETQYDVEMEYFYTPNERVKSSSALGYRYAKIVSPTNFLDDQYVKLTNLMTNFEYRAFDRLVINVGAMAEYNNYTGTEISPRIGLNILPDEKQTFRFQLASAKRIPNAYEQNVNFRWTLENPTPLIPGYNDQPVFVGLESNADLEAEEINSFEASYYLKHSARSEFEVKYFANFLRKLISESIDAVHDFSATNANRVDKHGVEIEASYQATDQLFVRSAYAYLDLDSTTVSETILGSRHSGNLMLIYDFPKNWQTSLAQYYQDDQVTPNFNFTSWVLSKTFKWSQKDALSVSYNLKRFNHFERSSGYIDDSGAFNPFVLGGFEDKTQHLLSVTLSY